MVLHALHGEYSMGTIAWVVLAILAVYGISLYNSLVQMKNAVTKAWANIDVLLKQRHDELPKLVDACKQYMQYEQATLEKVIQARAKVSQAVSAGDVGALGAAETSLRAGVGKLFALAESYPDLKSSEQFLHLQARISGLESAIADRREFYNDSVTISNVAIAQFPGLLLARWFHFRAFDMLEFSHDELADVDVAQRFQG